MTRESQARKAFIAPFAVFLLLLGLNQGVQSLFGGGRTFLLVSPQYWIYPLQTVVCGAILVHYWPLYQLKRFAKPGLTILAGVIALMIWIAPQLFFNAAPRCDGFNPSLFQDNYPLFIIVVFMRFLRSVVIVPLLEEIFWRGYLLRDLINQNFTTVAIGSFSWLSFGVVTAGFCLEHSAADWPAAALTGVLYNLVIYRTRSLSSCVLAHAVTNFILGLYIMNTKQWGFW
ncbi:MAG: CAAX prenyl protease-related protein [Verrucomicrobiota bacterium]